MRVLLLGFGNPGRQDDGLGPACAETVERMGIPGVTTDQDYQLTVEDAVAIGEHDVVVFADADAVGTGPWSFRPVAPDPGLPWTSHGVEPGALVALAAGLQGRPVEAYMLGIRGYAFDELREELTEEARRNLEAALRFLGPVLRGGSFRAAAGVPPREEEHPASAGEGAK